MASFVAQIFRTKPLRVIHAEESSQELPRSLSLFDLLCIGIGSTVGSGIFATTGDIISRTTGPAAVVAWAIAGVVCIINACSYMELTTRIPSSGSTYAYAYHALGELPAVIAAWLLTLEYGMAGSGVARSWADKMETWLHRDYPTTDFGWLNMEHTNFLAALIMALSVVVLLMGVRFGKIFVNGITTIKVGVVLFIIIAGFAALQPKNLSPFVPPRDPVREAYGWQGIVSGASMAFFGYIGFDEVCCLAAEAKNPKTTMPRAVIGVVLITMFLSVFASFALSGMVPYGEATDFAAGFTNRGLEWAAQIVRAGETVTMPVVVLVSFLAQPRLNYALACDGLMPPVFAKVNDQGNLFLNTLISGVLFTVIAFLVPFATLWDLVSFGILVSFVMSNASLLVLRTRDASPVLAPVAIAVLVFSALLSTFSYQIGFLNHHSVLALVVAVLFLLVTIGACVVLALKCPQEPADPDNYTAPLVPFIPALAIFFDFYLMAQISPLGMQMGMGWIAAACVSYFVYGYGNSAGRTGWSGLLKDFPADGNNLRSPMLSINEVAPSMSAMVKEKDHHR